MKDAFVSAASMELSLLALITNGKILAAEPGKKGDRT